MTDYPKCPSIVLSAGIFYPHTKTIASPGAFGVGIYSLTANGAILRLVYLSYGTVFQATSGSTREGAIFALYNSFSESYNAQN